MKLLYKPTGNVFTLPDEEVARILQADRGNDYQVVEAEVEETEETDQATDQAGDQVEETKETVEGEETTEETEETELKSRLKQFEIAEDYNNLTKKELAVIAERVTGRYVDPTKLNKADIINLIEGKNE
jgi:hypothetical protein